MLQLQSIIYICLLVEGAPAAVVVAETKHSSMNNNSVLPVGTVVVAEGKEFFVVADVLATVLEVLLTV